MVVVCVNKLFFLECFLYLVVNIVILKLIKYVFDIYVIFFIEVINDIGIIFYKYIFFCVF